jgi:hypothetical protein
MNGKTEMNRTTASVIVTFSLLLSVGCDQPKKVEAPASSIGSASASGPNDSLIRSRAVEAVIWGMPAVNYDLMVQAMNNQAHGGFNQIVYWSKLSTWKNQTLTPNPDAVYVMPFFNTKEAGPMVLEIPPAGDGVIVGSIDDCWQTAIEDVGPAGADKGKGGKYLILPPDYKGKLPAGYLPMPASTYESYALLRSNPKTGSDADVAAAVEYAKRIRIYPLSQAAHPPDTKWNDAVDVVFDSTIPYDERFFQSLDRVVQIEPWIDRDKAMIDQLKSIGIEKGKPFNPDAATNQVLKSAAADAHAWLAAEYEKAFTPPFYPGTHWALPVSPDLLKSIQVNYTIPNVYPVDARGTTYTMGFFSAKHLGSGQFYLVDIKDKNAQRFHGASTYKLTLPANAPVKQYWSVTVYDAETHAFLRNVARQSRSSLSPGLQKNRDGSVNIYFAPKAPGGKDTNWVPTDPNRKFELMFRAYGPTETFFQKTWALPDPEKVQ